MELLANTCLHQLVLMHVADVENVERTYTCEDKQQVELRKEETMEFGCF